MVPPAIGETPMFVPIEVLRVRIGLLDTDTSRDTDLEAAEAITQGLVEDYLDRRLEFLPDIETFYGGKAWLLLRRWPLEAAGAVDVTIHNEPVPMAVEGISVDEERGVVHLPSWMCGRPIRVEYTGGFTELPPSLLWAYMAAFDAVWSSTPGFGVAAGTLPAGGGEAKKITLVGIGAVEFDTGSSSGGTGGGDVEPWGIIPDEAVTVLDRYRRESIIGVG